MQQHADITFYEYMVMAMLSEQADRTLQLSELAELPSGSLSRLSHVLTRLERQGWVVRERSPHNPRARIATLTDSGMAKVVATAPAHVEDVRELIFDALDPDGVRDLARILAPAPARIRPAAPAPPPRPRAERARRAGPAGRARSGAGPGLRLVSPPASGRGGRSADHPRALVALAAQRLGGQAHVAQLVLVEVLGHRVDEPDPDRLGLPEHRMSACREAHQGGLGIGVALGRVVVACQQPPLHQTIDDDSGGSVGLTDGPGDLPVVVRAVGHRDEGVQLAQPEPGQLLHTSDDLPPGPLEPLGL